METTIVKNVTLSQLINKLSSMVKAGAASTYAYSDLLHDIERLVAYHRVNDSDTLYWGVRPNGTALKATTFQIAKWSHEQELEGEPNTCYKIRREGEYYTMTQL